MKWILAFGPILTNGWYSRPGSGTVTMEKLNQHHFYPSIHRKRRVILARTTLIQLPISDRRVPFHGFWCWIWSAERAKFDDDSPQIKIAERTPLFNVFSLCKGGDGKLWNARFWRGIVFLPSTLRNHSLVTSAYDWVFWYLPPCLHDLSWYKSMLRMFTFGPIPSVQTSFMDGP